MLVCPRDPRELKKRVLKRLRPVSFDLAVRVGAAARLHELRKQWEQRLRHALYSLLGNALTDADP
eukprot:4854347-Prorocentrum_lima.AAC.1